MLVYDCKYLYDDDVENLPSTVTTDRERFVGANAVYGDVKRKLKAYDNYGRVPREAPRLPPSRFRPMRWNPKPQNALRYSSMVSTRTP